MGINILKVLDAVKRHGATNEEIIDAVCKQQKISIAHGRYMVATGVQHLVRKGLVTKEEKLFKITEAGAKFLKENENK